MPREAIALGAAEQVVALGRITDSVLALVRERDAAAAVRRA
jgi:hypothetical protein